MRALSFFDAPASYGKHIPEGIAKITNKPIKDAGLFAHTSKDHIGGSVQPLKSIPGLQIIALDTVSDFLKEMNDPNRLIPTVTFKTLEDDQARRQDRGTHAT